MTDLKGKTVALQQGGPHVGMLDDVLKAAKLTWDDIKVVWTKDLTGSAAAPPELFRKRNDIDACFAITPDMVGLCGGLQTTGTGAEGTVKGARVLVSTAELSRSIADVYVCRKDFYDANKELITKFVAGYLKACEELIDLKKQYEAKGSEQYKSLLQLTQDIYGKTTIPVLDDAHGLLSDCTFVGYPGNVAFFTQEGSCTDSRPSKSRRWTWRLIAATPKNEWACFHRAWITSHRCFLSYLKKTEFDRQDRFRAEAVRSEIEMLSAGGAMDDKTIVSFTINFEPNQDKFSAVQYGAEYQRVVETADKFGNAVVAVRGHADPSKTLLELVKAGLQKGILKRAGTAGNYTYSLNGQPLDLNSTSTLLKLIEAGSFDGVPEFEPAGNYASGP